MGITVVITVITIIMKVFAILASLLVAAASAKNVPNIKRIQACAGHENDAIQLVSGNLPDSINIPGSVMLNMETKITEEIPEDLISALSLKKMDPFPVPVPCLNGFGSCPYDGCGIMNQLCQFAEPKCACPLVPGDYKFNNVKLNLPDLGNVMDTLMVGHYTGQMNFYSKANKDKILGCFDMDFHMTHN